MTNCSRGWEIKQFSKCRGSGVIGVCLILNMENREEIIKLKKKKKEIKKEKKKMILLGHFFS